MSKPVRARANAPLRGDEAPGLWHRPRLLNTVADVLLLLGSVGLGYAAVAAALRLPLFPLREVVLTGAVAKVTQAQLEYAARSSLSGNFFTVNLDRVRSAFEKLPWVRRAEVRRRWPDGIELALEEHVAAALWKMANGEMRVVNDRGEVFTAATSAPLPMLSGPEGSAAEVLQRYAEFAELLKPLGRTPRQVALSARQAWQVRLDDGTLIDLGRDQAKAPLNERLTRFVAAYPVALERAASAAASVDLRYPNGFALRPRAQ